MRLFRQTQEIDKTSHFREGEILLTSHNFQHEWPRATFWTTISNGNDLLMAAEIHKTWNDVASHWDDWGPPLRPCLEDIQMMRDRVAGWLATNPVEKLRVFLCGVTPEIVTMDWPQPIELTAMDQSQRMIDAVWPGDIPGVRRATVGNWLKPGLAENSYDIAFNDGGFGFFEHPSGLRELLNSIRSLIRPGGLFVGRNFVQAEQRESLAAVLDAARSGMIGSFHSFKWRLATALQPNVVEGIRQHDIWQSWTEAGIDPTQLPQPGWSARAVGTIEFYRDKPAILRFPTLSEFLELMHESFEEIEVAYGHYELSDRCPIVTAHPKVF